MNQKCNFNNIINTLSSFFDINIFYYSASFDYNK